MNHTTLPPQVWKHFNLPVVLQTNCSALESHISNLLALLHTTTWAQNLPMTELRAIITNSLNFFMFWEEEGDPVLIGYGRVVTDYSTYVKNSYIY